jgi:hypothetical protein
MAFDGMSYCSLWIATNHANAMSIPANDRRFTILRNGRAITPDEAVEIDRWMSDPANIGALSQMLAARDLSGFNMMGATGHRRQGRDGGTGQVGRRGGV